MTLKYFATMTARTRGKEHLLWLDGLRKYIKKTPDDKLLSEVKHIESENLLRAILEAGARQPLYDEIIKKLKELKK